MQSMPGCKSLSRLSLIWFLDQNAWVNGNSDPQKMEIAIFVAGINERLRVKSNSDPWKNGNLLLWLMSVWGGEER